MTRFLIAWGPAASWAAVLFLLSELPPDAGGGPFPINDKVLHLAAYLVLGGALAWGGWRAGRPKAWLLWLLGLSYGVLDEWHQAFVPGRDPSFGDVIADGVGVMVGVLLFRLVLRSPRTGPHDRT